MCENFGETYSAHKFIVDIIIIIRYDFKNSNEFIIVFG
jgi:hypothetical protein